MRDITISPVVNGFLVTVGCQRVVFTSLDDLIGELRRYVENPAKVEKEYLGTKHAQTLMSIPAEPHPQLSGPPYQGLAGALGEMLKYPTPAR